MSILDFKVSRIHMPGHVLQTALRAELGCGLVYLSGGNGAGKTSVIKALAGIYQFDGYSTIGGVNIRTHPQKYKEMLGYCPDIYTFSENISVQEYLRFVSLANGVRDVRTVRTNAEAIGLEKFWKCRIGNLSYGNKKKLLLIASVVKPPAVWLLDEPTNGLDKVGVEWLHSMFESMVDVSCVLMVCHSAEWYGRFNAKEISLT